jgi:Peptidase C65 Otubain
MSHAPLLVFCASLLCVAHRQLNPFLLSCRTPSGETIGCALAAHLRAPSAPVDSAAAWLCTAGCTSGLAGLTHRIEAPPGHECTLAGRQRLTGYPSWAMWNRSQICVKVGTSAGMWHTAVVLMWIECTLHVRLLHTVALFVPRKDRQLSPGMPCCPTEYQHGSEVFRTKIDGLERTYGGIRRARGDGNCFFRR